MIKKSIGKKSIGKKTFFFMLLLTFGMGLMVLVVGMLLYLGSNLHSYYVITWNHSKAEAAILDDVDVKSKCDEIIKIYNGFTDEERGDGRSPEYAAAFDSVLDDHFRNIQGCMLRLRARGGPLNAFIVAIDEEKNRMIYLIDSDENEKTFVQPGSWDTYSADEIKDLVYGRKLSKAGKRMGLQSDVQAAITYIKPYGLRCTGATTLYKTGDYKILVCVDERLNQMVANALMFLRQYVILLLGVTLIVSLIGTRITRKQLVVPIDRMANAAKAYGEDTQKLDTGKRYFDDLDIHTGDELENLAITMHEMEKDLAVYVQDLTQAAADKERIKTELSLASQIQKSMLPKQFPAFPDRNEFDVFASMEPAREVGGDFYDFFLIDDDHLAVNIADVSGKGIPAALFMMASKILLGTAVANELSPAQVLEYVNERICANNSLEMFVTVWLGILEISTGKLTTSNAGHEYPIMIHADGRTELIHDKHGFVIGGMEGMKYTDYEIQLTPGDKIFVYTDGVTEATSKANGLFGTDRLVETISATKADDSVEEILHQVHHAVDQFVGEDEQFDDLTMLCLEYRGDAAGEA